MNIEKFTNKSKEALVLAQDNARSNGNAEISSLHLLNALLNQNEGLIPSLIEKMGLSKSHLLFSVMYKLKIRRLCIWIMIT